MEGGGDVLVGYGKYQAPPAFLCVNKFCSHSHIIHSLSLSLSSTDAECLSFSHLHDGSPPSLHRCGGQCHSYAHREAAGHSVHGRG